MKPVRVRYSDVKVGQPFLPDEGLLVKDEDGAWYREPDGRLVKRYFDDSTMVRVMVFEAEKQ